MLRLIPTTTPAASISALDTITPYCEGVPAWLRPDSSAATQTCRFVDSAGVAHCNLAGSLSSDRSLVCLGCNPALNRNGLSPVPGTCVVEGVCFSNGDADPVILPGRCRICNSTPSATSWSSVDGWVVRTVGSDRLCFAQASLPLLVSGSCYGTGADGLLDLTTFSGTFKMDANRTVASASSNSRDLNPNTYSLVVAKSSLLPPAMRPCLAAAEHPRRRPPVAHRYARVLAVNPVSYSLYLDQKVIHNAQVDLVVLRVPN
jgi:hypothetical protein